MGLYDLVDFAMSCPLCGKEVTDFQTKNREDLSHASCEKYLDPTTLKNFYTFCRNKRCGAWIEFCYVSPEWEIRIAHGDKHHMRWPGARRLGAAERDSQEVLQLREDQLK